MTTVNPSAPRVVVAPQVTRTTPRPEATGFKTVMDVALRGVEIGAAFVGGPLLSAAVHEARTGAAGASGVKGVTDQAASDEQSTMDQMRQMQSEAQSFNLQYLGLQEEVQQENRRFTTVSNVLKAKHETAKSAIGNIRG